MFARLACIGKFMVGHGRRVQYLGVEIVFKEKAGERSPPGNSIAEFRSRSDREAFLSAVRGHNSQCQDVKDAVVRTWSTGVATPI